VSAADVRLRLLDNDAFKRSHVVVGAVAGQTSPWITLERVSIALGLVASGLAIRHYLRGR
jgi:hypothetical protein